MEMWRLGPGREPGRCSISTVHMISCKGAWMNWDAAWSSLCQIDPLPPMSLLKAGPPLWCLCFCLSSKNHWCELLGWHPASVGSVLFFGGASHWDSHDGSADGHMRACYGGTHTCTHMHTCTHTKRKWIGWPKVQTATFSGFVHPFLKAWFISVDASSQNLKNVSANIVSLDYLSLCRLL